MYIYAALCVDAWIVCFCVSMIIDQPWLSGARNNRGAQQAIGNYRFTGFIFQECVLFCISDIRFLGQLCGQCVVFEFGFPRSGCFSVAGNECSYVIECLDLWCFRTQKYKKHYSLISYNIRKFRKCCFWFLILRSDPFSPTSFLMGSCTPTY